MISRPPLTGLPVRLSPVSEVPNVELPRSRWFVGGIVLGSAPVLTSSSSNHGDDQGV